MEAADLARDEGVGVKVFKTMLLWPLPEAELAAFCESVKKVMVVEMNAQGQLAHMLPFVDPQKVVRLNQVTGEPISPEDILEEIKRVDDVLRKK